jgi:hypothetical protein
VIDKLNLMGAVTTLVIYLASILVFISRLLVIPQWGKLFGIVNLLTALPLLYLLLKAPQANRPPLYYLQVSLMLFFLLVLALLDYVFKVEFRQTRWMVIVFVTLFFAATGGMLGVASLNGRAWTITGVILFLIMAVLAFIQRAVTGM